MQFIRLSFFAVPQKVMSERQRILCRFSQLDDFVRIGPLCSFHCCYLTSSVMASIKIICHLLRRLIPLKIHSLRCLFQAVFLNNSPFYYMGLQSRWTSTLLSKINAVAYRNKNPSRKGPGGMFSITSPFAKYDIFEILLKLFYLSFDK